MIKVTAKRPPKPREPIISFPCIVTHGGCFYLALPVQDREQANKYYNHERDAVSLADGKFVKALNLDECQLYKGSLTIENEAV